MEEKKLPLMYETIRKLELQTLFFFIHITVH